MYVTVIQAKAIVQSFLFFAWSKWRGPGCNITFDISICTMHTSLEQRHRSVWSIFVYRCVCLWLRHLACQWEVFTLSGVGGGLDGWMAEWVLCWKKDLNVCFTFIFNLWEKTVLGSRKVVEFMLLLYYIFVWSNPGIRSWTLALISWGISGWLISFFQHFFRKELKRNI